MILAELFPYSRLIFTILYGITAVAVVGVVVSENRNPVKTLAWITVLVLLPVAGIVLYIFFGRSLKHVRMISRKKRRKLRKLYVMGTSCSRRVRLTMSSPSSGSK